MMIDFQIEQAHIGLAALRKALADAEAIPAGAFLRGEHIRLAREGVAGGELHLKRLEAARTAFLERNDGGGALAKLATIGKAAD